MVEAAQTDVTVTIVLITLPGRASDLVLLPSESDCPVTVMIY